MRAVFHTFCGNCGEPIEPGMQIVHEGTVWAHAQCPDPLAKKPGEQTCPVCFLVHPEGACDRD